VKTPLKLFIIVAVVAAVALAGAIALGAAMGSLHQKTTRADISEVSDPTPAGDYHVNVLLKMVGVDLDQESVRLQLECILVGKDLLDHSVWPAEVKYPITLDLGISRHGTQETEVFADRRVGGITYVDLDLDGNVEDYPRDRHSTTLWLSAYREAPGLDPDPVPIRLDAYGAWPGMNVEMAAPPLDTQDPFASRELDIVVTRSHATATVVYASVALTWILILSVIGMAVSVLFSRLPSEIAMLAFFGTLLFAMTAFRNALPGAPPMGTLSDYYAFFWGYAVAIVAIGVVAADYLRRRARDEPKAE
jgi:hypothetical protein